MAPSLLLLPPCYETFSKDLDSEKDNVMAEFQEEFSSSLCLQEDTKGLNIGETLKVAHKRGLLDNGESFSRILSSVAKKTSNPKKIENIIRKNKPSFPKGKAEFVGREEDVKKVTERLRNKTTPGMNLFGESGVGKTTLAQEVSKQLKEFEIRTVDLRDIEDMDTVYTMILIEFGVQSWDFSLNKVFEYLNEVLNEKTLLILDNVEQLLKKTEKQFTGFLKTVIETKACKNKVLKFILTSQDQVNEPSLKGKFFTEYKVQPLENEVSKKFITKRRNDVIEDPEEGNDQVLTEISSLCRDIPYLLQVPEQLMRFTSSTPSDVLQKLNSQIQQNVPKDFACISALFDSLPKDLEPLKKFAVKISLLRRPFSVSTAKKIAEISEDYDAEIDLEMLVSNKIISVVDVEGKRKYDTHGLFKDFIKYLCGSESEPNFDISLKEGEKQFFKHFSGKMAKLARNFETEFVATYSKLELNKANFELAIELSEENKETLNDLLLLTKDHNQFALMGIMFEVLKDVDERRDLFSKWADAAEKKGKWLASALMRCWQSLQCTDLEGMRLAQSTLDKADECIKKAEQEASPEQMNEVKSLYLQSNGKIKYYRAMKLDRETKEKKRLLKEGIRDLSEAISMRKTFMKDSTLSSRGLNLIGNCYMELDEPRKAVGYYEDAMKMKKSLVGTYKHWEFPTFYNQIAQVHDQIGRKHESFLSSWIGGKKKAKEEYEKAEEWTKKALELQEELEVSGTGHTATFQRNLANILLGLEKYDEALEYAKKSYEIRHKLLGQDPDTVRILYTTGMIHEWKKDPESALQSYEKGIEMEESLPEDNHSVVRNLLYDRLEEMCKRVKKKYPKPPENIRILYLNGISQEFKGKTNAALQSYEKALKMEEHLPDDNHSVVRKKLYNRLAEMYKKLNQEDKLRNIEMKINKLVEEEEKSESVSEPAEFEINVYKNGGYYNYSKYGHFIYFPPDTVTKPTKITCKVFNTHPILSPAKFTEGLASYIVELGPTSVYLQKPIIMTLLHSGPVKKLGYEITVRSFNAANKSWKEIEVLKEDSHAPEYCKCHYIQVSLQKLSTLAVMTRLNRDRFQVTPKGCVVRSSVYDDVTVEFPQRAVNKTLEGAMSILPEERIIIEDGIVGRPALLFHGFQGVVFSKPVKIRVPFASSKAPGSLPRLLRLDFDSQSNEQWKSVTDFNIEHGFMEFSVDHFSAFWPLNTLNASAKYVRESVNACYQNWFNPPNDVSFAAYMKSGQTGQDVDLKLTCVALDRQEALTDRMEGKSFTNLVESTGDQPMWCRQKAYPEVEGVSDWDKDFFLQFLGEDKECNKQFFGTAERDSIKLKYYSDPSERQDRLGALTIKRNQDSFDESSDGFIEYFGISFEILKDSPEDIAKEMSKHLPSKVEVSLTNWYTEGVIKFFSSLPRKEDCYEALVNSLASHPGAEHISRYLKKGHEIVTSPLKDLEHEIQEKVINIVASNTGYSGSKLANYLGIKFDVQVSQILRKWMETSDKCTIETLFQALKYLNLRKGEKELANYTTKLSVEKAQEP